MRADVSNLSSGQPLEVEDARPTGRGERSFQPTFRWERRRGDDTQLLVEPRLKWGFAERWQGTLSVRGLAGSAARVGSGDVGVAVLHQLVEESGALPALAASLRIDLPSGRDSAGIDTTLRLAATKTLGTRRNEHQVHLNAGWTRNAAPLPDERGDRGLLLLGYSTPLDPRTVLVADVFRQHGRARGDVATVAELGVRRAVGRGTTLSAGLGTGRGSDAAPRWRFIVGLSQGF